MPLLARLFEPPLFSSYRSGWRLNAYVLECVAQFTLSVARRLTCVASRSVVRGLISISLLMRSLYAAALAAAALWRAPLAQPTDVAMPIR